jgi:hypothetical protein
VLAGPCNPFSLFSLFTLIPYFFSFLSRLRAGRFWGYLGAPEGKKPPHQVNLDAFREKIFSVQGILTIEKGTHNQIAGIFPLGMVAQFVEFSWNL